jgi:hypothetical protein
VAVLDIFFQVVDFLVVFIFELAGFLVVLFALFLFNFTDSLMHLVLKVLLAFFFTDNASFLAHFHLVFDSLCNVFQLLIGLFDDILQLCFLVSIQLSQLLLPRSLVHYSFLVVRVDQLVHFVPNKLIDC